MPSGAMTVNSQFRLSVCHDLLGGWSSFLCPGSERGSAEVEPTLVEEPELLIRDPVHEDGVVVALFDALGGENNARPRCRLLVRQALVLGDPGDGRDTHVDVLSRKNILRFPQGHCRRLGEDLPDSPLLRLGPHRFPPLLLWPVEDPVLVVVLALADLPEELLCCAFGDPDRRSDRLCWHSFRLVELGEEATDDVLVYRRPLPPSLFGLVVSEFPGVPIGGLI